MFRQLVCAGLWSCAGVAAHAETFPAPPTSTIVGELRVVTAQATDTLMDLAKQFDLGFDQLVAANPAVDPWLPAEGAQVVLPTQFILPNVPRVGIVVNVAAMRLFYFPPRGPSDAPTVITYPVAIGRDDWGTPIGVTAVIAKERDPAWAVPVAIRDEHALDGDPLPPVVPPGPGNPLGRYALHLGLAGYLIHGTNRPFGIGMRLTHGCLRLYQPDIAALFERVPVGTPVRIIDERYLAAWDHGVLYVEAHPAVAARVDDQTRVVDAVRHATGARRALTQPEWASVLDIAAHPRSIPRAATAPGDAPSN